jgi:hypothetical protein
MPTEHIVALLIQERDRLNQAIAAMTGGIVAERCGRPPKNAIAAVASVKPTKAKRSWTAAQKKAAAERMKKRWAAKRKAEK